MKISDCCGAPPTSNGDTDLSEFGICSDCGEHCEYIDDEDDEDEQIESDINKRTK